MQLKTHDHLEDPLDHLELNANFRVEKIDVDGAPLLILRIVDRDGEQLNLHLTKDDAEDLRKQLGYVLD